MRVFINPGHGLSDPGVTGFGLNEADVALKVGALLENKLKTHNIETQLFQSDALSSVPVKANAWGADVFISIHCNAYNGATKGTETLVYRLGTQGAALADAIQSKIVSALNTIDRGLKERPGLCVLRSTDMPAVLVEMAFIDEITDNSLLAHKQEQFAQAIAEGVFSYLGIVTSSLATVDTRQIAPNGKPYAQNDIDYLLQEGYTLADALSLLDTTDKYNNSNIQIAKQYAESRVGTKGYGNNGCTEWVRQFLLKANHWLGKVMSDGSQGNLMWVPNIYEYAKANGLWKKPSEGGSLGDICLLETNYCKSDGPDHAVISCGDGDYWGNSSRRNKIVKSNIAYDYGSENVWGYVATGSGSSRVVNGQSKRTAVEIVGDADSSSCVKLAPNGMAYEENDIQYLINQGYSVDSAIEELSKASKYTQIIKIAPNGKPYEQNDIDYLVKKCGYTIEAAYSELSQADKYMK